MARVGPATPRDISRILELERRCYRAPEAYGPDDYGYALARAHAVNLKVTDGGRVVAFAGAFLHDGWRRGHVYTVNVDPAARGQGLGRRLLEHLEARMRAAGMERAVLEVNVANEPAIHLYERLGYERRGVLKAYYPTARERDAFVYEKRLI